MSLKALILSTFKGWLQLWIFTEEGEMERREGGETVYAIECVCMCASWRVLKLSACIYSCGPVCGDRLTSE